MDSSEPAGLQALGGAAGEQRNAKIRRAPNSPLDYVPASRGCDQGAGIVAVGEGRRRDDGARDVRPVHTRQLIRRRPRGTKKVIM